MSTDPTTVPADLDDAALASELVHRAGALAAAMRAEGLTGARKTSVSDVVTAADHAAEELVVSVLARLRPDDGVVGEEGAEAPSRSGRTWVIDPVDGTYNFLAGMAYWCSALALRDDTGVVLGAVHQPVTGERWLGGRDLPTSLLGSGSCDLAAVAAGRVGVWAQPLVPAWDWLPGEALVLGAGGRTAQVDVRGTTWSVAGRPTAVEQVLTALTR